MEVGEGKVEVEGKMLISKAPAHEVQLEIRRTLSPRCVLSLEAGRASKRSHQGVTCASPPLIKKGSRKQNSSRDSSHLVSCVSRREIHIYIYILESVSISLGDHFCSMERLQQEHGRCSKPAVLSLARPSGGPFGCTMWSSSISAGKGQWRNVLAAQSGSV